MIKKMMRHTVTRAVVGTIAVLLIAAILYPVLKIVIPDIIEIVKNNDIELLEEYINAFGVFGIIVAIILQVLQVISIVIPAPLIWVAVGASFGIIQGMIYCCMGMVVGNGLVFAVARRFKWSNNKSSNKKNKSIAILDKIKNPDVALFFMYMLPGVPNGVVPYIYAQTKISLTKFMCIIGVASIPSILFSTCVGKLLLNGQYISAGVTTAVLGVVVVILMRYREWIIQVIDNFISKSKERKVGKCHEKK